MITQQPTRDEWRDYFVGKMRELSQEAWNRGFSALAIELEAAAYRRLGVNFDRERRERLDAVDRYRTPATTKDRS